MSADDFKSTIHNNVDMGDGTKAVGGSWSAGSGEATAEMTIGTKVRGRFTNPLAVAAQFEQTMRSLTANLGASKEQVEAWRRAIIERAIDQQVLELYRQKRVANGNTDHKKLLRQERLPRNMAGFMRAANRAGVELGWLFGLGVRWKWPTFEPHRPYDWKIDGCPPPTSNVTAVIGGKYYSHDL